ncbi:MAG: YciI family protein [Pirellulales bacterium]
MKYMLLIYSRESDWSQEEWTRCTVESSAICRELAEQGKFIAASPLHPVTSATSIRVRDGKRLVTDGPFAETTEQLGGYYILDVENLDEAIAVASRLPPAKKGTVEIRPIYQLPDSILQGATHMPKSLQPYLFYGGRCEEALEFYKRGLGATVTMMMTFRESPAPPPPGMLAPGFEDKIMHASVQIGETQFMASDGCDAGKGFEGFRLALQFADETAARKAFDALAQGGKIDMPLTPTFWSPCYGMVTDPFGLGWMVMVST